VLKIPAAPGWARGPARNANIKLFASNYLLSLAAPRQRMAAGKLKGSHHPISGSQGRPAKRSPAPSRHARPAEQAGRAPAPSSADNQNNKTKKKRKGFFSGRAKKWGKALKNKEIFFWRG